MANYANIPATPPIKDAALAQFLAALKQNVQLLTQAIGGVQPTALATYPGVSLPPNLPGLIAYQTDGQKPGEVAGKGTGTLVFSDLTKWTQVGGSGSSSSSSSSNLEIKYNGATATSDALSLNFTGDVVVTDDGEGNETISIATGTISNPLVIGSADIRVGTGVPSQADPDGSLYLRTDIGQLYQRTPGPTPGIPTRVQETAVAGSYTAALPVSTTPGNTLIAFGFGPAQPVPAPGWTQVAAASAVLSPIIALDYAGSAAGWGGTSLSYTTGALTPGHDLVIGVATAYPYAFANTLATPGGWYNLGGETEGNFSFIVDQLFVTSASPVTYAPTVTNTFFSSGGCINAFAFKGAAGLATGLGSTGYNSGAGAISSLALTTVNASPAGSTIFVFVTTATNTGWGGANVTDTVGNIYTGVSAWDIGNSAGMFFYCVNAAALAAGDVITANVPGGMVNGSGMSAGSVAAATEGADVTVVILDVAAGGETYVPFSDTPTAQSGLTLIEVSDVAGAAWEATLQSITFAGPPQTGSASVTMAGTTAYPNSLAIATAGWFGTGAATPLSLYGVGWSNIVSIDSAGSSEAVASQFLSAAGSSLSVNYSIPETTYGMTGVLLLMGQRPPSLIWQRISSLCEIDINGVPLTLDALSINFTGGVTGTNDDAGNVTIALPPALAVKGSGVVTTSAASSLNFTGAGITVTDDGAGNETILIQPPPFWVATDGEDGQDGLTGPQGPPGPAGPTGPAGPSGASATSWLPLINAADPPGLITDGAGNLITVGYAP